METITTQFRESARTTKHLWAVVTTAMLLALNAVLSLFNIQISQEIRVSFGFLAIAMIGMLFGPVMGLTAGVLGDFIGMLVKPVGAYFPGYTLTALLCGLTYGLLLYRKQEIKFTRCLITMAIVNFAVQLTLNTLWSAVLMGNSYWILLPARALKNLLLWPIESLLLFAVARGVRKALRYLGKPVFY